MKKTLLCLFLLVAGIMNAQIVNIPDANFKSYLLNYLPVIDVNNDGEIQVIEAAAVTNLEISNLSSTTILNMQGLEAFTNLNGLSIGLNGNLGILDLTNLQSLQSFDMNASNVENIIIGTHLQLISVTITINDIDAAFGNVPLDFSGCPNIETLDISNGRMSSLNLTGCTNLQSLNVIEGYESDVMSLTTLDLSTCTSLKNIYIILNNLTSLNLGDNTNLTNLFVYGENLDSLDASGCTAISRLVLDLGSGTQDVSINLKNGNPYYGDINSVISANNTNAGSFNCYVCIDEGEEVNFSSVSGNVIFSTYCSFTPGGDYNTITGTVSFDSDNNGCTTTDAAIPFSSVQINDGTVTGSSSASGGSYNFYTQAGTFALTPQFENNYFTASTETVTFADNNNNTVTQNFCVTANGVHNDAEVIIVPIIVAQPGFDAIYKVIYKNKGNQTLSGDITFSYNDAMMDYVSASPVETTTATGSLTWNYTNLLPFESREIYVILNVNSPMETPAVNIGDVLAFTAAITPAAGDEIPDDNTFDFSQGVVGSFDPNDITCLEGNAVSPDKIGEYLHYNINFENTGTAPATFVVVKDIIDTAKFDISSLQILNASHAVETRVTGNKVEFYFDNINLAANGGKGNVSFKIKSLNNLAVNSSVMQKADIYFDYNWPIVTNEATTTFGVLNAGGFTKDATIKVYPNPAKNSVTINAESAIRSVQLYDVQGRLLEAVSANDITATLDVLSRANGIYFIKVTTDKGVNVEKLIKQ